MERESPSQQVMSEVHGPQTIGDCFQAEGVAHEGESHVQGLITLEMSRLIEIRRSSKCPG